MIRPGKPAPGLDPLDAAGMLRFPRNPEIEAAIATLRSIVDENEHQAADGS